MTKSLSAELAGFSPSIGHDTSIIIDFENFVNAVLGSPNASFLFHAMVVLVEALGLGGGLLGGSSLPDSQSTPIPSLRIASVRGKKKRSILRFVSPLVRQAGMYKPAAPLGFGD